MNKKYIIPIIMVFLFVLNCIGSYAEQSVQSQSDPLKPAKALVVSISDEQGQMDQSLYEMHIRAQIVYLEILNGQHKGERAIAEYYYEEFESAGNMKLKDGDKVLVYIEEDIDGNIAHIDVADFLRQDTLLLLTIGFFLLLIILGGLKGLKSLVALVITCLAVIKVMLPAILSGANPIITSVVVCIGIIIITLLIVGGINYKSLSAIIGCAGGVLAAGIIALIAGYAMRFTGLGDEESKMLLYIPQNIQFNFQGLLFAGIIVGALGAAMDVGMSIASAMNEIAEQTKAITMGGIIKAGLNIGRDIMGTMSNTLILAYTGGSLQLLLLIMAYDISFVEIINREIMAIEILRAIAGSIGLLFTIPITSITAGFLLLRKHQNEIET